MPICRRFVPRALSLLFVLLAASAFSAPAFAQESVFSLDPAQTEIHFTLDTSLHTVQGTFRLKSGEIHFNPASGKASGAIVVDATSGESDNSGRDKKMHKEVLESPKFTEIVFVPSGVQGTISPQGSSQVAVAGVMKLHGQDHEMTLQFTVEPGAAGRLQASTHFSVPYVKWGLKNPGNFMLHADNTVEIDIHASGQLTPGNSSH